MNSQSFDYLVGAMPENIDLRRKSKLALLQREVWAWVIESDLPTMRRGMLAFSLLVAIGVPMFSRLVLTFPPMWQKGAFTPPFPFWSFWLIMSVATQARIISKRNNAAYCRGSVYLFFVLLGLVMPLFTRMPFISSIIFFGATVQGVVAARMINGYRRAIELKTKSN